MKIILFTLGILLATTAQTAPYDKMKITSAIERYENLVKNGGWDAIDDNATLREGDSSAAVTALVQRLSVTGELSSKPQRYTAEVSEAVRAFQHRHGLKEDGIAGKHTIKALNVQAKARVKQLRLTLERIAARELSSDSYVLVNIPEYRLHYIENGKSQLQMRVVVGKAAWDTPDLSDEIEHVVFQPRWNIPVEIVAAELAPKVAKNPDYLAQKKMTVVSGGFFSDDVVDPAEIDWANVREDNFPYFVRQSAGPDNPLGQIKFIFPNNQDIYLHDTPQKQLFGLKDRAQSHGCIRVEEPKLLARALIDDTQALESAMNASDTVTIALDKHVPVHLVYWPAWVNPDGEVHFREDIYDRLD